MVYFRQLFHSVHFHSFLHFGNVSSHSFIFFLSFSLLRFTVTSIQFFICVHFFTSADLFAFSLKYTFSLFSSTFHSVHFFTFVHFFPFHSLLQFRLISWLLHFLSLKVHFLFRSFLIFIYFFFCSIPFTASLWFTFNWFVPFFLVHSFTFSLIQFSTFVHFLLLSSISSLPLCSLLHFSSVLFNILITFLISSLTFISAISSLLHTRSLRIFTLFSSSSFSFSLKKKKHP